MATSTRNAEISPKASDMSIADIALHFQARVGAIASFVAPNRPLKDALPAAASFIGLGARRVRALWAMEARAIRIEDQGAIEAAEVRISEHVLTQEVTRHANRLEVYAARLAAICPERYRAQITKYRGLAKRARSVFDRVET